MVIYLSKNGIEDRIYPMNHYCEADDFNRFIYHSRSTDADDRIAILLRDADTLLERCKDLEDVTEYQLLVRCISEQTVVDNNKRRLKTKADGTMSSDIMQSPVDPDATYREKAGKKHRGYSANIEETVGENGSVVTDYQFEKNNVSDSVMLKEHLENMDEQPQETTIITDGAYSGTANTDLAASKNVKLVTTDLTGKDVDIVMGAFEFNDDGTEVLSCPAGHKPKSCTYISQSGMCQVSYAKALCEHCPYKIHCHPKMFKRISKVSVSKTMRERARLKAQMDTIEFKNYSKLRNGVETVPSILKNIYGVNKMRVHGKIRCKFYFGSKVAALNFRKLFRYRKGLGHYAKNPLLAGC